MRAAQTRLRPILMTSIAFVIAVTPLVFASGAGEAARHSLGTVVFGGMLMSTFLNLGITPVLYVIIKSLEMRGGNAPDARRTSAGESCKRAGLRHNVWRLVRAATNEGLQVRQGQLLLQIALEFSIR